MIGDKVSVLMCVFNTPVTYLKEACDSILGQTYDNIEFVIVDDASDDPEVIAYLKTLQSTDERVCLYRNSENIGLTRSLNVGLPYCRGRYIARMDSDDISSSDRIEKQYQYMESNPEVALVGSDILCFGDGMEESVISVDEDISDDPEMYSIYSLLRHSGPPHPTFMFRKDFLDDNSIYYREDILKAQDYGIMVDVLKAGGQIRRISEPLLKYRIHKGQISVSSETAQKAYQSRVSFDYIRNLFPSLTETECAAISLLGCSVLTDDLLTAVKNDEMLRLSCVHLLQMEKALRKPAVYIRAVKKIIRYNNDHHLFNPAKFESVIRSCLWKKALRTTNSGGRPWGMTPYTLMSYRFVK